MAIIDPATPRYIGSITPEASVQDAARLMSELNVGALPVCDGDALLGTVTDRDIMLRATARGRAPRSLAVAEVMNWHEDDCAPDTGRP